MSTSDSMDIGVGLGLIVIIAFSSIALGVFLPAQFSAVNGDSQAAYLNQSDGTQVEIYRTLEGSITDISQNNVTVTLLDTDTKDTKTFEVSDGQTVTKSIRGFNISVTVNSINEPNDASMTFEYPQTYGLTSGVILILSILESFIMLSFAFAVIGLGAKAMGVV